MPKPARSPNGHRRYGHELLKRLFFIRRSRELGFSLKEVRSLLDMIDNGDYTCDEVKALTVGHHAEIRHKISDLRKLERVLKKMADQCDQNTVPECPVIDALYGELT